MELENLREKNIIKDLKFREKFLKLGIIEKIGKTSGIKYMLSRRYYEYEGNLGTYSGIRGLSRQSKKELILQHLERNSKAHVQEFVEAFPDLKRQDINNLMQELKNDGHIYFDGKIRSKTGVWKLVRKHQN